MDVATERKRAFVMTDLLRPPFFRVTLASKIHANMDQQKWKPPLRPLIYHLPPTIRKLTNHQAVAQRMLYPAFTARAEAEKKSGYETPQDTIQWMLERLRHRKGFYWFEQRDMRLTLALATIHKIGTLLTHILFDLAAGPDYLKSLREEVRQVLVEDLGALTKQGLTNLCHMYSSMKESQRLNRP